MFGIEVLVGLIGSIVGYHLFGRTFEAHALAASRAQHLVASVDLHHRHSAVAIWTSPNVIFNHVFEEIGIGLPNFGGLIAAEPWMQYFLNNIGLTLHLLQ